MLTKLDFTIDTFTNLLADIYNHKDNKIRFKKLVFCITSYITTVTNGQEFNQINSKLEWKKAYRKVALIIHPDKVSDSCDEYTRKANALFLLINNVNDVVMKSTVQNNKINISSVKNSIDNLFNVFPIPSEAIRKQRLNYVKNRQFALRIKSILKKFNNERDLNNDEIKDLSNYFCQNIPESPKIKKLIKNYGDTVDKSGMNSIKKLIVKATVADKLTLDSSDLGKICDIYKRIGMRFPNEFLPFFKKIGITENSIKILVNDILNRFNVDLFNALILGIDLWNYILKGCNYLTSEQLTQFLEDYLDEQTKNICKSRFDLESGVENLLDNIHKIFCIGQLEKIQKYSIKVYNLSYDTYNETKLKKEQNAISLVNKRMSLLNWHSLYEKKILTILSSIKKPLMNSSTTSDQSFSSSKDITTASEKENLLHAYCKNMASIGKSLIERKITNQSGTYNLGPVDGGLVTAKNQLKLLNTHRHPKYRLAASLMLSLTGIGLLLGIAQLVISKAKNKRPRFLLFGGNTNSFNKALEIEKSYNNKPGAFS